MEESGVTMDKHDVMSITSSISMAIFLSIYLDKGSFLSDLKKKIFLALSFTRSADKDSSRTLNFQQNDLNA